MNSQPLASILKSFSQSLEQFFLTVSMSEQFWKQNTKHQFELSHITTSKRFFGYWKASCQKIINESFGIHQAVIKWSSNSH